MKKPKPNILEVVRDPKLFDRWFRGDTWQAWLAFLAALFGLPMDEEQAEIYKRHTGRATLPTVPAREGWLVVGRRGGKSLIAALVAVFLACFRDYAGHLAPGEVATVMVIAADRRQARVVMRYIGGFLDSIPMLAGMVTNQTKESIELSNRVVIEVHTCSFRAVRGYTLGAAVCDEIAFWRSEESANPDTEVIAGLRPGLATIPGSLLLCISSPYARRGALWQAYQKHFGKDSPVLVWQAETLAMNPTVDPSVIEQAYEEDESSARAEYGAQFRADIESYVDPESVAHCVIPGRTSLEPAMSLSYRAFVDVAGGSGQDSFTWCIAHSHGDLTRRADEDELPTRYRVALACERLQAKQAGRPEGMVVVDLIKEVRPPFSPEATVEKCATDLARYRVREITGDRFAGEWPREIFRKFGIEYKVSEQNKSELYQAFLPLLNSGKVELPDDKRLLSQLVGLERRTARSGRDSIDHELGSHDDCINSAAGACVLASAPRHMGRMVKLVGI